jgi:alkyl hydroperoxide reductase subunit D
MAELATPRLDALKDTLPDPAKDLRLNLGSVLNSETLTPGLREEVLEDAQAAASIMAMNTVYYRFRHLIRKESYAKKPARLRMQWMARPKAGKELFELMSMAIAALAGCEMCMTTHEASILQAGGSEEQVHDAIRIASVLSGFACACGERGDNRE